MVRRHGRLGVLLDMKRIGRHTLCLISILGMSLQGSDSVRAQVAVVANADVQMDTISRTMLVDYFTRDRRTWPDGTPVVLFDLEQRGPVRDLFYHYLGIRPSRLKSIWLKQLYSGEGQPPRGLETEESVVERVRTSRGGLGYVGMDHAQSGQLKILLIIPASEQEGIPFR